MDSFCCRKRRAGCYVLLYTIYNGKHSIKNVETNQQLAWEWLNKSAEMGFIRAQREVGDCYRNGIFVNKDSQKAYASYYSAMENGDVQSIKHLAKVWG